MLQRQIYVDVVNDDWNLYCSELMTRCLKPRDDSLLVNILINLSYKFVSLIKLREIIRKELSYLLCSLKAQICLSPH
jgi:hypothetical protein